jgi:hypothetical protein
MLNVLYELPGNIDRHESFTHVATHPLVPKLIAMVLAHLSDDKHSLFSALLVNPPWTRPAVPILWRDVSLNAVLNVGDRARRRQYADRVLRLSVYV